MRGAEFTLQHPLDRSPGQPLGVTSEFVADAANLFCQSLDDFIGFFDLFIGLPDLFIGPSAFISQRFPHLSDRLRQLVRFIAKRQHNPVCFSDNVSQFLIGHGHSPLAPEYVSRMRDEDRDRQLII
jgi:hypothetical protein